MLFQIVVKNILTYFSINLPLLGLNLMDVIHALI
jgi:hypothetical protein